jgi:hypothetical protein
MHLSRAMKRKNDVRIKTLSLTRCVPSIALLKNCTSSNNEFIFWCDSFDDVGGSQRLHIQWIYSLTYWPIGIELEFDGGKVTTTTCRQTAKRKVSFNLKLMHIKRRDKHVVSFVKTYLNWLFDDRIETNKQIKTLVARMITIPDTFLLQTTERRVTSVRTSNRMNLIFILCFLSLLTDAQRIPQNTNEQINKY